MTIRDLTKRQLYNLRRRCEKERKQSLNILGVMPMNSEEQWRCAYNKGLRAGLSLLPPPVFD